MTDRLLDQAGGRTVLAIGDVMLDRFVSGRVDRISPEAPIPVLKIERETAMAGGVGNVVANVRALGGRAQIVALVGADAEAGQLARLLGNAGDGGLVVDPARPTAVKTRFIAGGQQLLRADFEASPPAPAAVEDRLIQEIDARIGDAAAIVLSDYGKGVLTERVLSSVLAAAAQRGTPVIVDPKGADYGRYRGASVVTPNLKELAEAAGPFAPGDAGVAAAAQRVLARSGIAAMVATRGGEGLSVIAPGLPAAHIRAQAREVFDVSGAGDTVVATLSLALATGAELQAAAALANLAASIVVGKVGTASVSGEELRDAAESGGRLGGKLLAGAALTDQIERWRRRRLVIGFTNGCFDLLHPGHLSLLRQARAACDRLLVALNSDDSVRRLKGPTRPVTDQESRAVVLSALADVDAVAIFDDDTPARLIESVRPDVLVKGADYAIGQIVGADFVLSYGGRVLRASLEPGRSTTAIVTRIAAGE